MKNYLIGGLVVVIIILGLLLVKPKGTSDSVLNDTASTTSETSNTSTIKTNTTSSSTVTPKPSTTLATNLFPKTGSYECRYDQITQETRSSNIVYIADGKMRGEFRSTDSKGMSVSNMMVYNAPYLYMWVEGKSVGTISQPKSLKDIPAVIPTDIHEGKVLGSGINNVSWDCHAWSKVNSMLSKPTYVTFY